MRHYLQDVGSTFGAGANGPRDFDEGWESLFDAPRVAAATAVTFGLYLRPWQRVDYPEIPSIGRFEGRAFDPRAWSPRVPPAAILRARADDEFWAARRVMAFTDEMIAAAVRTGAYSDPRAEAYLTEVLIARRDAIGRAYLPAITPLADFAFDPATGLSFVNVAERAKVADAPTDGYRAQWLRWTTPPAPPRRLAVRCGPIRRWCRPRRGCRRATTPCWRSGCGPSTCSAPPGPRRSRCRSCAPPPAGAWSASSGRSRRRRD